MLCSVAEAVTVYTEHGVVCTKRSDASTVEHVGRARADAVNVRFEISSLRVNLQAVVSGPVRK